MESEYGLYLSQQRFINVSFLILTMYQGYVRYHQGKLGERYMGALCTIV